MKGIKKMAERKPYTTKTRQIILEYLKSQKAVTVSVADIEKYLKTEGIKVNTTTVYRYLDKLCAEHIVIKYPDLNSDKAVFQFAGDFKYFPAAIPSSNLLIPSDIFKIYSSKYSFDLIVSRIIFSLISKILDVNNCLL